MSYEQIDPLELGRLELPKTKDALRGIDRLLLQKVLNLTYNTNDLWARRHKVDQRDASDISAAGAAFTAPVDARRIVFDFLFGYTATATVGTRSVVIDRRDKVNVINRMIARSVTAGVGETYQIGPLNLGSRSVNTQISMPLVLEPEWRLIIDDANNIDALDDVSWTIDYLEIPI